MPQRREQYDGLVFGAVRQPGPPFHLHSNQLGIGPEILREEQVNLPLPKVALRYRG